MLDLFTIFTKGGIVLWYFQGTALSLTPAVNSLIKSVILQERGGVSAYNHENLTLKFKMDNELELIYVVVYQNILQLSYVDKLLDQVQLAFRDRYKNEVASGPFRKMNFSEDFEVLLRRAEEEHRLLTAHPRKMKSFQETRKAEKVQTTRGKSSSSVVTKPTADNEVNADVKEGKESEEEEEEEGEEGEGDGEEEEGATASLTSSASGTSLRARVPVKRGVVPRGGVRRGGGAGRGKKPSTQSSKLSPKPVGKRVKEQRRWDGVVSSAEAASLDHSLPPDASSSSSSLLAGGGVGEGDMHTDLSIVGTMKGDLEPLTSDPTPEDESKAATSKPSSGGVFSFFKTLTGGKTITQEALSPALERMQEHLITKNVAVEIAEKLCDSVAAKLEGKVIGTFSGVQSLVLSSMEESLVQILSPKRRVDILRDVMGAKARGQPYTITFCGVNGVGKSTNLAKVCFWLLENGFRVLIAGCDTFRSGAVEQLRTHTRHLSSLHPPPEEGAAQVMLYERGYGKDAAGIATEAVRYARQQHLDVVLVDTAGRMQNNEPLMRALAKLIRVNSPDLVLFVGEALVGNEAVDQLTSFNQALLDHSEQGRPRTIDGILLTKFDTIDDKVGAAISMTYTTGQPIVFVGTGQTYKDLKTLNVQAVITALLK